MQRLHHIFYAKGKLNTDLSHKHCYHSNWGQEVIKCFLKFTTNQLICSFGTPQCSDLMQDIISVILS